MNTLTVPQDSLFRLTAPRSIYLSLFDTFRVFLQNLNVKVCDTALITWSILCMYRNQTDHMHTEVATWEMVTSIFLYWPQLITTYSQIEWGSGDGHVIVSIPSHDNRNLQSILLTKFGTWTLNIFCALIAMVQLTPGFRLIYITNFSLGNTFYLFGLSDF